MFGRAELVANKRCLPPSLDSREVTSFDAATISPTHTGQDVIVGLVELSAPIRHSVRDDVHLSNILKTAAPHC